MACVSNLSTDPLGRKLPSCSVSSPKRKTAPKAESPKKKPAPKPKPAVVPVAQFNVFEQVQYYQIAQPAPPPQPKKEKKAKKPAHVCVNCSAKEKCKACKKKEDDAKKWVYKPTFWQPRQPPKSVFVK